MLSMSAKPFWCSPKLYTMEEAKSGFFKLLISATSQESSKRFVVIATILVFLALNVITSVILVLIFTRTLPASQGTIDKFYGLYEQILNHDFYIICFGIGAVTISNSVSFISTIFTRRADAAVVAAEKGVPDTVVKQGDVQNQTITPGTVSKNTGGD